MKVNVNRDKGDVFFSLLCLSLVSTRRNDNSNTYFLIVVFFLYHSTAVKRVFCAFFARNLLRFTVI